MTDMVKGTGTSMPTTVRIFEHEFYGLQIVPPDDEAFRIDWPVHFERSVEYICADEVADLIADAVHAYRMGCDPMGVLKESKGE